MSYLRNYRGIRMERKPYENVGCEHVRPRGSPMAVNKPRRENLLRLRTGALWACRWDFEIYLSCDLNYNNVVVICAYRGRDTRGFQLPPEQTSRKLPFYLLGMVDCCSFVHYVPSTLPGTLFYVALFSSWSAEHFHLSSHVCTVF